jgi:hypothetical protein
MQITVNACVGMNEGSATMTELAMLTRAVRELDKTRIEPDYSARKRMRREGNGVDMQSLADEISRETEASVASRSGDYDDTDPLYEIRQRLRKLCDRHRRRHDERCIGSVP